MTDLDNRSSDREDPDDKDKLEREELLLQQEERNLHAGNQRRRYDDPDEAPRQIRARLQDREEDRITDSNIEVAHSHDAHPGSLGGDTDSATEHTNNRTSIVSEPSNHMGIEATLVRLFPHGFPPETIAEELKAQADVKGDGT